MRRNHHGQINYHRQLGLAETTCSHRRDGEVEELLK